MGQGFLGLSFRLHRCAIMSFTMANLLKCRVLAGFVCSALFASFVGGQQAPTTSAADTPASKHIFEFGGNSRTYSCFIPKVEGALPLEYVYRMIDNALIASGQTPPPPPPAPTQTAPQTTPANKPGN